MQRKFGENCCRFSSFNFQGKWPQEISQKHLDIFHSAPNKVLSLLQLWGVEGPREGGFAGRLRRHFACGAWTNKTRTTKSDVHLNLETVTISWPNPRPSMHLTHDCLTKHQSFEWKVSQLNIPCMAAEIAKLSLDETLGSVLGRTDFSRIFIFGPPIFSLILSPDFFSSFLWGKKCPEKSSRKIPGKFLPNLYNKNPRHISAEGPGQETSPQHANQHRPRMRFSPNHKISQQ